MMLAMCHFSLQLENWNGDQFWMDHNDNGINDTPLGLWNGIKGKEPYRLAIL
jgi:hypothetical protein